MNARNPYTPPRAVVDRVEYERQTEPAEAAQAGAWFAAGSVDLLIMLVVSFPTTVVLTLLLLEVAPDLVRPASREVHEFDALRVASAVAFGAVLLLYHPLLESSPWQASLGKRLCRLRLASASGRRITLVRALARHLANLGMILGAVMMSPLLLLAVLGANAAMITVTPRGQALHDLVTGMRLVRVPRGE